VSERHAVDAYLERMGLTRWVPRAEGRAASAAAAGPVGLEGAEAGATAAVAALDPRAMGWEALCEAVEGCRACALHLSRQHTVFGTGSQSAHWLFVGEAPGAEEDRQGEPFVGRAGKLLDAMLAAVGLARQGVYIANVLKCRPPGNRDPLPEEASACAGYINRQIELLAPRVIVALGRIAAQHLLATTAPLGRLRGRAHVHPVHDVPVVVTYHPAYLLRSPGEKAKAWADLLLARSLTVERAP
jgi:uracil-DNA glycosylase